MISLTLCSRQAAAGTSGASVRKKSTTRKLDTGFAGDILLRFRHAPKIAEPSEWNVCFTKYCAAILCVHFAGGQSKSAAQELQNKGWVEVQSQNNNGVLHFPVLSLLPFLLPLLLPSSFLLAVLTATPLTPTQTNFQAVTILALLNMIVHRNVTFVVKR